MERLKGMLFGAFVGDAYALGFHWVYDTDKIVLDADKLEGFMSPIKGSFHQGKRKGDFTHYGDQSLLLLKSISTNHGFDIEVFKTHWLTYMSKYEGYMDHASKESIALLDFSTHTGSSSDELGGISRVAPLIFYHFDDPQLHHLIETQTRMTHNSDTLLIFSQFTVKVVLELIIGKSLNESLGQISKLYPTIDNLISKLSARMDEDTVSVVKDIGQSCSCLFAFPSALYIAMKYPNDFKEAMRQNVLAGGDSAGRGMLIGMLLGAQQGYSKIPEDWIRNLNAFELIHNFTQHKII